jgi:uncharacterized protein YutD
MYPLYTRCTYDKKLEMIQPLVQEFCIFGFGPLVAKNQIGPKFGRYTHST